jgi:hypothetical protein
MIYKPLIVPTLTYRYQKLGGGIIFKTGLSTSIYPSKNQSTVSPWFELGAG